MKIALLTNAIFPRDLGGTGRIAFEQAELLRARGFDVRVFRPDVPWIRSNVLVRLFCHVRDLGVRSDVLSEVLDWKPDALLTANLTGCGFGTAKRIQSTGATWVHVLHDVQLFEPSGRLRSDGFTLWQRVWSGLRRHAFGRPDVVVSPTRWLLDQHKRREWFADTTNHVLPNPGVASMEIDRSGAHDPIRLGFLGGFSQEKGLDVLLNVLLRLSFPFELHLIGEGDRKDELVRTVEEVVDHGRLDRGEILRVFSSIDVLLVPSQIAENQPTVILEAMTASLPVIASDVGGVGETLDGAGLLCRPDDVSAWVTAIERLQKDRAVFHACAEAIGSLAVLHDPNQYADVLVEFLRSKRKTSTS